jgi:hypothetical protein
MNSIQKRIVIRFISLILSFPFFIGLNIIIENIFIVETAYCYDYRFPKLAWFLDYFYEGYHYDRNIFSNVLSYTFSLYFAHKFMLLLSKKIKL